MCLDLFLYFSKGYAFVYALAPVARMSPYWRDNDSYGIPVITSVGLTSNLGISLFFCSLYLKIPPLKQIIEENIN